VCGEILDGLSGYSKIVEKTALRAPFFGVFIGIEAH